MIATLRARPRAASYRRLAVVGAAFLAVLVSLLVFVQPSQAAVGLRVSGGRLVEANGTPFVMRGVSHPHVWYTSQTSSFANIGALGANTVRVVLGSGQRWGPSQDVGNVIDMCKAARLICVLEVHDTTGFGEEGAAATLDQAVSYWISVQDQLVGEENYAIINLGNEPIGNNNAAQWTTATRNAITRMRNAGFDHTLMVDAPNWGQDWQFVMRDNAASIFNSDVDRNTVFSVHMYGVFDTAAEVTNYMQAFQTAGLPLVVGEFGHNHSDGNPDEDTIMAQAQSRGIGYIGWSWSGNSGGVEYLDMVTNFNPNQLTSWGQRIFNGANGIVATSRRATIYGGGTNDTTPPSTPGTPSASSVTATTANLTWGASTDTGGSGLAGYNVYREQGTTDPQLGSSTTNSVQLTGLTPNTQYQVYVRARDGATNLSGNSPTVTFTTQQGPVTGPCRVTYSANNWGGSNGFTGNITIANTGTSPINGWTLAFTFPSGQRITDNWGATWNQASGSANVTATNLSWNGDIPAGNSISIGFNATHTGTNTAPNAFTINGTACATS
jgi:mannan endo-1,4-beta-mannosidase